MLKEVVNVTQKCKTAVMKMMLVTYLVTVVKDVFF